MIPPSTYYKAVRKSDGKIIAEGSKKNMLAFIKKSPVKTFLAYSTRKIGEKF